MNVLFLDIDGVVNTHMIYKELPPHLVGKRYLEKDGYIIDICSPSDKRVSNLQAVTWLDHICHKFNLKIVISSTWRLGHPEECKQALYDSGLSKDIEIIGVTPSVDSFHRGTEISIYLAKHPEIDNYVIFDDDIGDMDPHDDHVVKIDTYAGITIAALEKVSYIIGGETE